MYIIFVLTCVTLFCNSQAFQKKEKKINEFIKSYIYKIPEINSNFLTTVIFIKTN